MQDDDDRRNPPPRPDPDRSPRPEPPDWPPPGEIREGDHLEGDVDPPPLPDEDDD